MPVGTFASAVHIAAPACTDVLTEPFDNLTAWTTVGGTPTIVAGRTGTALENGTSLDSVSYTIPAPSESAVVTFGFAWKANSLDVSKFMLELRSDSGATVHNRIMMSAGAPNSLAFTIGTGAEIASTPFAFVIDTWYYIEGQITLGDLPNGKVVGRVNGTEIINVSNLDTKNGGTKTVYDQVRLLAPGAGTLQFFDDLYISTGAGCAFKGDITVPLTCTTNLNESFNNFSAWANNGAGISGAGRNGSAAFMDASFYYADRNLSGQDDMLTVGFALKWTDATSVRRRIIAFMGQGRAIDHNVLWVETTGALTFTRDVTTIASSAATGMVANIWYYVEVQVYLHDTLGFVKVRLNGTEVINATALDTRNGPNTVWGYDGIQIGPRAGGMVQYYDDLYLTTGRTCTFQGDHAIP